MTLSRLCGGIGFEGFDGLGDAAQESVRDLLLAFQRLEAIPDLHERVIIHDRDPNQTPRETA